MGKHSASGRRPISQRPAQIERVRSSSMSAETPRQTRRRQRESSRFVDPKTRRLHRRRTLVLSLVVVAVCVLGAAVAGYAYMRSVGNKLNRVYMSDTALQQALSGKTAQPGAPFYMVLMGSDTRAGESQQRSDTLIVARVDPQKKKVKLISIPRDSRVDIPGYGTTKINAAASYGGPALVIKTVKALTGLPITHYVNIDFFGFRDIVDAMGGVWIDIPQKIYDRQASAYGSKYATIPAGYQKLDGRLALTYVRSRHAFAAGDYARMEHQQSFIKAIAKQSISLSNIFKATSIINAVASHLSTDLSPDQLAQLVMEFKGMDSNAIESATAPSAPQYIGGVSYVILDMPGLQTMIARMTRGDALKPSASGSSATSATPTFKASSIPLTIRNGAGVSGLAKEASDFFKGKGFSIADSGNMSQFVYGRTLVVYQSGKQDQANFVRETLGLGDVIPSAGMYQFKTPVMIVIGKDWRNPTTNP